MVELTQRAEQPRGSLGKVPASAEIDCADCAFRRAGSECEKSFVGAYRSRAKPELRVRRIVNRELAWGGDWTVSLRLSEPFAQCGLDCLAW